MKHFVRKYSKVKGTSSLRSYEIELNPAFVYRYRVIIVVTIDTGFNSHNYEVVSMVMNTVLKLGHGTP